ncbi:MAG: hypothetical protein INF44_06435, partial [Thalassospira sp.]|nr:hypothetical protein [Thalassospira sp.]
MTVLRVLVRIFAFNRIRIQPASFRHVAKKLLHTALSISIIIPHQAFAAPDGNALPANPQLTVGTADISSANNTLTI